MTAIILAGGKSKRLGKDKALLNIGRMHLIELVIERVRSVFNDVLIVTPNPSNFNFLNKKRIKILRDAVLGKGPLGGIYTGLLYSNDEYSFVCGCDMPFLNPSLLRFMAQRIRDADILVPEVDGFLEPLHSIYSKRCIEPIRWHLEVDDLKVKNFFPEVRCRPVPEKIIKRYDPSLLSFFNLNTPKMLDFTGIRALDG